MWFKQQVNEQQIKDFYIVEHLMMSLLGQLSFEVTDG